jgi:hypothetical protein
MQKTLRNIVCLLDENKIEYNETCFRENKGC